MEKQAWLNFARRLQTKALGSNLARCPQRVISGHHSGDGVGPLCAISGHGEPSRLHGRQAQKNFPVSFLTNEPLCLIHVAFAGKLSGDAVRPLAPAEDFFMSDIDEIKSPFLRKVLGRRGIKDDQVTSLLIVERYQRQPEPTNSIVTLMLAGASLRGGDRAPRG